MRPGDMVTVEITYAAPHHLVADGAIRSVRRTRAGDAWERRTSAPPAASSVGLGMPSVGVPAPLPARWPTPAADGSPRISGDFRRIVEDPSHRLTRFLHHLVVHRSVRTGRAPGRRPVIVVR